jgi:hypothetical protein
VLRWHRELIHLPIVGECRNVGVRISATSVRTILRRHHLGPAPRRSEPSCMHFLRTQAAGTLAGDFLTVDTGIRVGQAGHRVAFATAAQWVSRLVDAHHNGKLQDELTKLGRIPLIIIDLCRDRNYA